MPPYQKPDKELVPNQEPNQEPSREQVLYQELIAELKLRSFTEKQLASRKRELARKHHAGTIPTNIQILLHALPKDLPLLRKKLLTKPVRSISGVAPIALMTAPSKCPHGKCTFCAGGIGSPWGDVPQSYTGHEPATMRGMRNSYDSYLITFNRLEQYVILGHEVDKVEFILMGGTFPAEPLRYQREFVRGAFQALNDFSKFFFDGEGTLKLEAFREFFELPGDIHNLERTRRIQEKLLRLKNRDLSGGEHGTLEEEQRRNETAKVRCVALCIETKPDWGLLKQGNEMLLQGCTRVELGIQSVYDDVLKHVHRGHTAADSKTSIQILRDLGFKINFHYMPGLPLTDRERDIAGMKQLFADPAYRPDMLKLYPCMVAPGTALYQQWKQGLFEPIDAEEAAQRIVPVKEHTPEYCRIQRIQRDVPTKYWAAGVEMTNFRQYIHIKYKPKCRCIRCREPMGRRVNWDAVRLKVTKYEASQGKEFFIAAEDVTRDIIIGFCRLRFPSEFLRPEIIPGSALVRELHVYGTATAIGEEGTVQHRGWGRKLMEKAEEIAREQGKAKMVVISGAGAREYYRKLGYEREGPYMVKMLK